MPWPGIESISLALEGRFLTTGHQGGPSNNVSVSWDLPVFLFSLISPMPFLPSLDDRLNRYNHSFAYTLNSLAPLFPHWTLPGKIPTLVNSSSRSFQHLPCQQLISDLTLNSQPTEVKWMLAASRALPSHFPGLSILPSFKRTIFYVPSLPKTPTPPSLSSTLNCRLYLPFYGESTRKLPRAPSTSAGSCLDPFIMLFLWLLWMSCLCFCLQPKSGETRNHPLSSIQGLRLQQFLSPSSSSSCPLPDHSH